MKEIAVFGLGTLGKSLAISYSNMGGKSYSHRQVTGKSR